MHFEFEVTGQVADKATDQRVDLDIPLRKKRKSARASGLNPKRQRIISAAGVDRDKMDIAEDDASMMTNPKRIRSWFDVVHDT